MLKALNAELNNKYIDAVMLYEEEIKSPGVINSQAFINLAFLYWSFAAQENEFNAIYDIPEDWSNKGGKRFSEVLNQGLQLYPNNLELHFWQQYLTTRLFGGEFSEKDCQSLLEKYGKDQSLIPYFFLYLFDKNSYEDTIRKLIVECESTPTAKNLYVRSFLPCFEEVK